MELLAGLVLSLTAAVVGVWQVAKRDRPSHGMPDEGMLGLPRLQRWDVSYHPPRMQRLRSRIPRFEASRAVLLAALLIALAVGGFVAYTHTRVNDARQSSAFEQRFAEIQARHSEAKGVSDIATSYAMLVEARAKLDELAASQSSGKSDARIADEHAAILADIDALSNAQRFQSAQTVGAVPAAPAGVTPRLVAGGGRVYLLSDALYQVDSADGALVRLLGSGDSVGDATVGTLRGAAWRDDRPVVMDEAHVYALDPATGAWAVEALGTFDQTGFTDVRAIDEYGQNLYALTPGSGQVLKFSAGSYDDVPQDWTAGTNKSDLQGAVDIAVDGHVYTLLSDGRVLDFFMSRLEATLAPTVVPPLDAPAAIVAAANSAFLYLLNGSDGRILRLARDGSSTQQFLPADDQPRITGAQDFVLDEGTGVAFILARNVVYAVRITPPR